MKIVEVNCIKKLNVDAATAWWNQWDHEHFSVAHEGFKQTQVFYEDDRCAAVYLEITLPILSFFKMGSLHFMVQKDDENMLSFSNFLGCPSVTHITIKEIEKDFCEFNMNYKFLLGGWKVILAPIIKFLAPKWNERSWKEDLPLKQRRFFIKRKNFIDFKGITVNDKKIVNEKMPLNLPQKKMKESKVFEYLNKYFKNYKND
jgi:hypothetical protein